MMFAIRACHTGCCISRMLHIASVVCMRCNGRGVVGVGRAVGRAGGLRRRAAQET